jgi:hypothetical protein
MAQSVTGFKIVEIGKPKLGSKVPASLRANVSFHLNTK